MGLLENFIRVFFVEIVTAFINVCREYFEVKLEEHRAKKRFKDKIKEIKNVEDPKERARRMRDFLNGNDN